MATEAAAAEQALSIEVPEAHTENAVRLDGAGLDNVWARATTLPALKLVDGSAEVTERASKVQVVRVGAWLLFAIDAKETTEIIAREGTHGVDLWFDDAFFVTLKGAKELEAGINALGSVWTNRDGGRSEIEPVTRGEVRGAARIEPGHWRAELAINLRSLQADKQGFDRLTLKVERSRQQRGLTAYEGPSLKNVTLLLGDTWTQAADKPLDVGFPQRFGGKVVLPVARCAKAPDGPDAWAHLPAVLLNDETGLPPLDPDFQQTVVRAAFTETELVLQVVCKESNPEAIEDGGEQMWREDNVEVFLGPEGYNYLQVATNPKGKMSSALGRTGGRRVSALKQVPEGIRAEAKTKDKSWVAWITIPFAAVQNAVGASPALHPAVYPWRVQISRNRPARKDLGQAPQYSVLAVTRSANAHCPLRFAAMTAVEPSPQAVEPAAPAKADLPAPALDAKRREELGASTQVLRWVEGRSKSKYQAWEDQFSKIQDVEGWKQFAAKIRENLFKAMFPSSDGKMPKRGDLNSEIVYEYPQDGFNVQGLIFESRPGVPVPATLYMPKEQDKNAKRPALIMIPAHHTPRNSLDLYITGANIARAGGIALATESVGSGERCTTARWEHKNYQRNLTGTQLTLAGEELAGWTAFDISRAVDYLLKRGDVDPERIGIVGGVAGGGDVSALAAALDERIGVSIPFNFSYIKPMGAWYDPLRSYAGAAEGGFTMFNVNALVAPRYFIQAHEFEWRDTCVEAQARYEKVYDWFGAKDHLSYLHGGENTHATHFNYMHRLPMYKILSGWWKVKLPETREAEFAFKISNDDVECFDKPKGRAYLARLRQKGDLREPHELAAELARTALKEARQRRQDDPAKLRADLDKLFGDTGPTPAKDVKPTAQGAWRGASVASYWLPAEAKDGGDLGLALWVLSPKLPDGIKAPPLSLVLGVAQSGKARFLAERTPDIEALLKAGVAVALLDVRGTGETSAGPNRFPESDAATAAIGLWQLNDSLPARQLKDVRTALAFLAAQPGIDSQRIALWGESFSEPNAADGQTLLFEETGFRQASPTPRRNVEPAGPWSALLAALYPVEANGKTVAVQAVLARGGLASYASVLDDRHYYLCMDAVTPGLLRVADAGDVARALAAAKVRLFAEDLRDGKNRVLNLPAVRAAWGDAAPAGYVPQPTHAAVAELIKVLAK